MTHGGEEPCHSGWMGPPIDCFVNGAIETRHSDDVQVSLAYRAYRGYAKDLK